MYSLSEVARQLGLAMEGGPKRGAAPHCTAYAIKILCVIIGVPFVPHPSMPRGFGIDTEGLQRLKEFVEYGRSLAKQSGKAKVGV